MYNYRIFQDLYKRINPLIKGSAETLYSRLRKPHSANLSGYTKKLKKISQCKDNKKPPKLDRRDLQSQNKPPLKDLDQLCQYDATILLFSCRYKNASLSIHMQQIKLVLTIYIHTYILYKEYSLQRLLFSFFSAGKNSII